MEGKWTTRKEVMGSKKGEAVRRTADMIIAYHPSMLTAPTGEIYVHSVAEINFGRWHNLQRSK
jgi:hypothetical protein